MKNLPFHFLRKRISKTSTQVELKIMRLGTSKNRVHLHFKEGDNLSQNSEPCHWSSPTHLLPASGGVHCDVLLIHKVYMVTHRILQSHKDNLSLKYPKTLTLLDNGSTAVITKTSP